MNKNTDTRRYVITDDRVWFDADEPTEIELTFCEDGDDRAETFENADQVLAAIRPAWRLSDETEQAIREHCAPAGQVTLDTRLADIGWDNAHMIDDTLIDTTVVGDDWGWAWDRVLRADADATVADLRDELAA